MPLQEPTPELVKEYIDRFDNTQIKTEGYIDKIIAKYPKNVSYDDVLYKVIIINSLYNTNVKNVFDMAHNIVNLVPRVDDRLDEPDLMLVEDIAKLTGDDYGKNGTHFYSFATKYCNWHRKGFFPIYDSNADVALKSLRDYWKLIKFNDEDLILQYYGYGAYRDLIVKVIKYFELTDDNSIKQIDKFLWLYGKEIVNMRKQRKRKPAKRAGEVV